MVVSGPSYTNVRPLFARIDAQSDNFVWVQSLRIDVIGDKEFGDSGVPSILRYCLTIPTFIKTKTQNKHG